MLSKRIKLYTWPIYQMGCVKLYQPQYNLFTKWVMQVVPCQLA